MTDDVETMLIAEFGVGLEYRHQLAHVDDGEERKRQEVSHRPADRRSSIVCMTSWSASTPARSTPGRPTANTRRCTPSRTATAAAGE